MEPTLTASSSSAADLLAHETAGRRDDDVGTAANPFRVAVVKTSERAQPVLVRRITAPVLGHAISCAGDEASPAQARIVRVSTSNLATIHWSSLPPSPQHTSMLAALNLSPATAMKSVASGPVTRVLVHSPVAQAEKQSWASLAGVSPEANSTTKRGNALSFHMDMHSPLADVEDDINEEEEEDMQHKSSWADYPTSPIMVPKLSFKADAGDEPRIGIDIGGVITRESDPGYMGDLNEWDSSWEAVGAFDAVKKIVQVFGVENTFLVSKVRPGGAMHRRMEQWMHQTCGICEETGLKKENIVFVKAVDGPDGKGAAAQQLGLSFFVDDKIEVLKSLWEDTAGNVRHLIERHRGVLYHFGKGGWGKKPRTDPNSLAPMLRRHYQGVANWEDVLNHLRNHLPGSLMKKVDLLAPYVEPAEPVPIKYPQTNLNKIRAMREMPPWVQQVRREGLNAASSVRRVSLLRTCGATAALQWTASGRPKLVLKPKQGVVPAPAANSSTQPSEVASKPEVVKPAEAQAVRQTVVVASAPVKGSCPCWANPSASSRAKAAADGDKQLSAVASNSTVSQTFPVGATATPSQAVAVVKTTSNSNAAASTTGSGRVSVRPAVQVAPIVAAPTSVVQVISIATPTAEQRPSTVQLGGTLIGQPSVFPPSTRRQVGQPSGKNGAEENSNISASKPVVKISRVLQPSAAQNRKEGAHPTQELNRPAAQDESRDRDDDRQSEFRYRPPHLRNDTNRAPPREEQRRAPFGPDRNFDDDSDHPHNDGRPQFSEEPNRQRNTREEPSKSSREEDYKPPQVRDEHSRRPMKEDHVDSSRTRPPDEPRRFENGDPMDDGKAQARAQPYRPPQMRDEPCRLPPKEKTRGHDHSHQTQIPDDPYRPENRSRDDDRRVAMKDEGYRSQQMGDDPHRPLHRDEMRQSMDAQKTRPQDEAYRPSHRDDDRNREDRRREKLRGDPNRVPRRDDVRDGLDTLKNQPRDEPHGRSHPHDDRIRDDRRPRVGDEQHGRENDRRCDGDRQLVSRDDSKRPPRLDETYRPSCWDDGMSREDDRRPQTRDDPYKPPRRDDVRDGQGTRNFRPRDEAHRLLNREDNRSRDDDRRPRMRDDPNRPLRRDGASNAQDESKTWSRDEAHRPLYRDDDPSRDDDQRPQVRVDPNRPPRRDDVRDGRDEVRDDPNRPPRRDDARDGQDDRHTRPRDVAHRPVHREDNLSRDDDRRPQIRVDPYGCRPRRDDARDKLDGRDSRPQDEAYRPSPRDDDPRGGPPRQDDLRVYDDAHNIQPRDEAYGSSHRDGERTRDDERRQQLRGDASRVIPEPYRPPQMRAEPGNPHPSDESLRQQDTRNQYQPDISNRPRHNNDGDRPYARDYPHSRCDDRVGEYASSSRYKEEAEAPFARDDPKCRGDKRAVHAREDPSKHRERDAQPTREYSGSANSQSRRRDERGHPDLRREMPQEENDRGPDLFDPHRRLYEAPKSRDRRGAKRIPHDSPDEVRESHAYRHRPDDQSRVGDPRPQQISIHAATAPLIDKVHHNQPGMALQVTGDTVGGAPVFCFVQAAAPAPQQRPCQTVLVSQNNRPSTVTQVPDANVSAVQRGAVGGRPNVFVQPRSAMIGQPPVVPNSHNAQASSVRSITLSSPEPVRTLPASSTESVPTAAAALQKDPSGGRPKLVLKPRSVPPPDA